MENGMVRHLLLVEKDAPDALRSKARLEQAGWRVTLAESGERAVEIVQKAEQPVDLAVIEVEPGPSAMDGAAAAGAILALRDTPVLFLTDFSDAAASARAGKVAAYGYVEKHGSPQALTAAAQSALRLWQARRPAPAGESGVREPIAASGGPSQAENQLRQWENIVQQADWGVVVSSQDGRSLALMNPAFAAMHGAAVEELTGRPILDLFAPDVRQEALAQIQIANTHGRHSFESAHLRKDGSTFPVQIDITVIRGEDGAFQYRIVNVQDITARKQREAELRFQARLLGEVRQAVTAVDMDGRCVYWNPFAEGLFGFQAGEVLGKPCIVAPPDPPRPGEPPARHWKGERTAFDRGGKPLVLDVTTTLLTNEEGAPSGYVSVINEISERKRAEAQTSFFASLIEQVHNGVIAIDFENKITFWNGYAQALYGWSSAEAVGKNIIDLLSTEELKGAAYHNFENLNREGHWEGDFNVKRKDGSLLPAHITNTYLKDAAGANIGFVGISQDITERLLAQKEITESEIRFSTIFHASQDAISLIRQADGAYLDVNEAFCTMFEMAREQVVGKTVSDLDLWADTAQRRAFNQAIQTQALPVEVEAGFRTPAGKRGSLLAAGRMVEILGEKCVLLYERDITLRRLAEENLERFFNLIPDMVCVASADGYFTQLNKEWERILGFSRSELMAAPLADFIHPDDRAATFAEIGRQVGGEATIKFANRYLTKAGGYRWLEWYASPSPDGATLYAAARDITERKQAEAALRESEAELRITLNTIPDLIWSAAPDGAVDFFNQAWLDFTGLNPAEAVGSGWLQAVHPDQLNEITRQWADTIRTASIYEGELCLRSRAGAYHWFLARARPVFDPAGRVVRWYGANMDITALKQAQDEARRSAEELRKFASQVPGMLYQFEALPDGMFRVPFTTDSIQDYFGVTPEEVRDDFSPVARVIHPDDVDLVTTTILHSIQTLEPFQCEYRVQVPGKALKWLWAQSIPERLPGGKVLFHGFNTDITDRKLLEDALRESEERFAKVFSTSEDVMGIFRVSDSVCIDANPAFCAQLGRARDELVGHAANFEVFTDPSVGKEFFRILRSQRSVTNMEGQFRTGSGALGVCLASAYLVDIHGETCILFYAKDITALKQAESSLRESEERFNRAFRGSPIGINLFRLSDGRSIDVNDAYVNLTGYTREELVGHSAADLNLFVNAEDRAAWMRTLRAQGFARNIETAIRTRAGDIRHSLFSVETLELGGEKVALVLNVDMTAQKQAEAMLLAANEILDKRVRERTAELDRTNAALQQALRARDEFMAAMSHELRTPLTGVLGIAESLEFGLGGSLTEKQQTAVAGITKNGLRLLELIDDILAYTALLSGKMHLEAWRFSLTAACENVLRAAQAKAAAKQQRVSFRSAPENILFNGDERRIKQILENLLDNAVKFTPSGGQVQLALTGQAAEGQVVISLTDSGIGIKAEDFARLFQPFVQLDARLSRVYEGTGLGLALVKGLVELHGGRVEVESVFGQGSTFRVILPWDGQGRAENPETQTAALALDALPDAAPGAAQDLTLLPRALVDGLVTAAAAADFDELMTLLEQAAGHAPAWAARLRTLAANYQYDALMDQLRPAAGARGPG